LQPQHPSTLIRYCAFSVQVTQPICLVLGGLKSKWRAR